MTNEEIARDYVRAVEEGATGDRLAAYFADDYEQIEYPNPIVPNGATRRVADILAAAERGQKVMSAQRFEISNVIASGDFVVVETLWVGTLSIAFGSIPIGGEMRAHIAMTMEFRDGKIVRQRNYDCYEPF